MSVYFNGETLIIPGAYSAIDVSQMATKSDGDGAKIIAIIGECTGGVPGDINFISNPVSAKKILKSGELLTACNKAWNPVSRSKEGVALGGANIIACIRTNKGTKATATVNSDQLVFSSKDWNTEANQIQVKIQDGTLSNTKKIIINNQATEVYENFDNVGGAFTISYTGNKAYATLSITKNESNQITLVTKVGDSSETATEDIKILLDPNVIKSIRGLVARLQAYENYKVAISPYYNARLSVDSLDLVENANIKHSDGQVDYRVTNVYADLSHKLKNGSELISLESYNQEKGKINNFEYISLTGGTDGTSPASWIPFFDALTNYDITYIVPLTDDPVVHAELMAHVDAMSGSKGRERRMIIGGGVGESLNDTIERAKAFVNARAQVVHGGFYDYDGANLVLYPPYILAAQHAGRCAFLEDGETATHDVYRMASPEYKLETDEIEELLKAGCLAFEFVLGDNSLSSSFVRLVQDITTDTVSEDVIHTERAMGALADSLNKEIRKSLDSMFTGKRTGLGVLTSIKNRVISILFKRKLAEQIVEYKDVVVTKSGVVTYIDYSVAPAEPNNFILITAHYYSKELTVE